MRYSIPFLLVFTSSLLAYEDNSIEILKNAVKAHGGKVNLAKLQNYHYISKGVIKVPDGRNLPFDSECWHNPPNLARLVQDIKMGNKTFHCVLIAKRTSGWAKIDDQATHDMSEDELKTAQEKAYQWRIAMLYPLIEESTFAFKRLDDKMLDDVPVVGIRVSSKGHWDVDFLFEKRLSLLIGVRSKEVTPMGELTVVTTLTAHKDFDGLMYPTRIERSNGTVRSIEDIVEFTPMHRIDERLFERP